MARPLRTARVHIHKEISSGLTIQQGNLMSFVSYNQEEVEALVGEDFTDIWDTVIDSFVAMNLKGENDSINFAFTQQDINESFVCIFTPKSTHEKHLFLIVLTNVHSINGVRPTRPFVELCDLEASNTLINRRSFPHGAKPLVTTEVRTTITTQGTYNSNEVAFLNEISLPEFVNGRRIQGVVAHLFNSPSCPYNIIFRYNFLSQIGLKMDFENNCIQWFDTLVNMKNIKFYDGFLKDVEDIGLQPNQSQYLHHLEAFKREREANFFDKFLCDDAWDNFATEILE